MQSPPRSPSASGYDGRRNFARMPFLAPSPDVAQAGRPGRGSRSMYDDDADMDGDIDQLSLHSLLLSMEATHTQLKMYLRSVESIFSQETDGMFFKVNPLEAQKELRRFKRGMRSVLRMQRIALGTYSIPRMPKARVPKVFACSSTTPQKKLPILKDASMSTDEVVAESPRPSFPVEYFSPSRPTSQRNARSNYGFHETARYGNFGDADTSDDSIETLQWEIKVLNEIRSQLAARVVSCSAAPSMTFDDVRDAMERVDREINTLMKKVETQQARDDVPTSQAAPTLPFQRLLGKILSGPSNAPRKDKGASQ